MSPDFPAPTGVDDFGGASPVPPHVQTEIDALTDELQRLRAEHDAAYAAQIDPMARVISDAGQQHALVLSEVIGDTDSTLRAAASPHVAAVVKAGDGAFRELAYAQEDMRANGIPIPTDIETVRAQLEDPNGDAIINMLQAPTDGYYAPGTNIDHTIYPEVPPVTPDPLPIPHPVPVPIPTPIPPAPVPPPVIVVPPPPPAPAPVPVPPITVTLKSECPDKPCAPPSNWERSQACPDARPFYESNTEDAVAEGRAFLDPYNLRYYYTEGVPPECIPAPPKNLDPLWITRLRGDPCPPSGGAGGGGGGGGGGGPPPEMPPDKWPEVGWDGAGVCAGADEFVRRETVAGRADRIPAMRGGSIASAVFRFGTASLKTLVDGVTAGFSDEVKDAAYKAHTAFTGDFFGGFTTLVQAFTFIDPLARTNLDAAWSLGLKLSIVHGAETQTGFPISYLCQTLQYQYQYANPQYLPTQGALDTSYLNGEMTIQDWRCLTRALGNLPGRAEQHLRAQRNRVGAAEIVDLWRRGEIKTEAERNALLFARGYMDQREIDQLVALSVWVPTPPDVVRFMVRDVFDPNAVAKGGYDKDFEVKYFGPGGKANPGPAAQYLRAFGVGEEEARLFWRAHWEMPSPTQLYEMLHRLRPDRPEVKEWERAQIAWINGGRVGPAPVLPPIVRPEDVREALEIDDKAPGWIDRLMAISYNPMTRTDAINAFMANLMDASELTERFQDSGMDLPTAKRAVEIQTALRARRNANVSGVWTIRKILRAYKDGALNGIRADALLLPLVPDAGQRAAMIAGTDAELEADVRKSRVRAVSRDLVRGAINVPQAVAQLQAAGLAAQHAQNLADLWFAARLTPRKEATARMIVEWVTQLILSVPEAMLRLRNIGYSQDDADLIVKGALVKTVDKLHARYKSAKAEFRTEINDMRAAARQETAALTARQKEIEKQIEKWQKEQERIQKELESRA